MRAYPAAFLCNEQSFIKLNNHQTFYSQIIILPIQHRNLLGAKLYFFVIVVEVFTAAS